MKFLTLKIENFGSIGSLEINLADQNLVLITGRNEDAAKADSNGAGKSLILEAFCWCLWGKTIRGLTGDDVVNEKVGKDCRVTVSLLEGEDAYDIVRTRKASQGKPNDLRLYLLTDMFFDMTRASMAATQELIIELVGMTFDLFCVMMPGAGKRAAEMTDREVKALLERLLQTEVLGKAHDEVKSKSKSVEKELSEKRVRKEMLDRSIDEYNGLLGSLKEQLTTYDDKKHEAIMDIQSQLGVLLGKMEEQDVVMAIAAKAGTGLFEARGKLKNISDGLSELYARRDLLRKTYEDVGKEHNLVLGAARQKIQSFKQKISSLPDGGACPTCHQEVAKDYVAEVSTGLGKHLQTAVSEEEALVDDRETARVAYARKVGAVRSQIKELQRSEDLVESDVTRFTKIQGAAVTAQAVKAQLVAQHDTLFARQAALQAEENPFQGLIAKTCEDAYNKVAEASRLYGDVLQLEHKQALLDYWLDGFSPQGIRSFMLEHVTPLLNHSAAKYADLLTDGEMSVTFHTQKRQKSGKIVERFNIQVDHLHGGKSYAASSAGEKSRANLVVAFALGDLAALRANKTVSFRFLDEPFENVDESGTDAIVALLNDQKERFETVFVITHQDHFKQLFPNRLTVVKKDGFTALGGDDA